MTSYFSTLCIKVPHNKLLKVLYELIDFWFFGAMCISDPSTFTFTIHHLPSTLGSSVGSDPALLMTNLLVYCYEDKWIRKQKKEVLYNSTKT